MPLRVLLVEDSPDDAELIALRLKEEGFQPDWRWVESEPDYLAALDTPPDLILSDWSLPQFSGLRALQLMRERGLDVPFIVVSGSIGEEAAVEALRRGAYDYVLKDRPARLGAAVAHALEEKRLREEKREAERALQDSEQKYRTMVERSVQGIIIFQDDRLVFVNPAIADMLGYTPAEMTAFSMEEIAALIHPEDRAMVVERIRRRLAGEPVPSRYEFRFLRRDGTARWVSISSGLIEYDGRPAVQTVALDITERVHAEEARARIEAQMRLQVAALEATANAIVIADRDGMIEWANPAFTALTGYSLAEALGRNPRELVKSGKQTRAFYADLWRTILSGRVWRGELVNRRKDGGLYTEEMTITPVRGAQGKIERFIAVKQDITGRKQAEENLRESEHKFRSFIEQSDDGIVLTNEDGRIIEWNRAAERVFGIERADALGRSLWDIQFQAASPERRTPQAYEQLKATLQEALRSGVSSTLNRLHEVTVHLPGGERRVVQSIAFPILTERGYLLGSINRDITERVRMEEERIQMAELLAHERDLLQTLMDNVPDSIYFKDAASRFTRINRAQARILGVRDPAEAIGRTDAHFFEVAFAQETYRDEQAIMETGQPLIGKLEEIRLANGEVRWFSATKMPIVDDEGRVTGIVGISRDISLLKQTELAMEQYAERLRTLRAIDGAILAAWSREEIAAAALRHIRKLVPCQRACVIALDAERQEATILAVYVEGADGAHPEVVRAPGVSLPIAELGDLEPFRRGGVRQVESGADAPAEERPYCLLWGAHPPLCSLSAGGTYVRLTAPLIAHGELLGLLTLGADEADTLTTDHVDIAHEVADELALGLYQARMREQIERHAAALEQRVAERTAELSLANAELARAARLKDEFLAAMSHELRTPLNAILGLAEALQEEVYGPLTDRQIQSLHTIEESGRHLLMLINDILDVSKIEAGKAGLTIGPVSVESVCQASLGLVKQEAHKKQLTISTRFDPQGTTIQADVQRLKQILVNLLSNAVKFTPAGGSIGLEVEGDAEQEVMRFVVWDTGIGIAPEHMDRLFKPFVQLDSSLARSHTGTGLGLALVHRLVDMHGGSVAVESAPGKGSRFTVSLPWREGEKERGGEGEAAPILPFSPSPTPSLSPSLTPPLTILLVEDNEANLQMTADYLASMGYRMILARSGAEGIEQALAQRPDLILMDIQMPGMDGLEAIRRIRVHAELAHTPIIALTALAMPGDRERCLEAGANGYLSKPVGLKGLMHAIEEVGSRE